MCVFYGANFKRNMKLRENFVATSPAAAVAAAAVLPVVVALCCCSMLPQNDQSFAWKSTEAPSYSTSRLSFEVLWGDGVPWRHLQTRRAGHLSVREGLRVSHCFGVITSVLGPRSPSPMHRISRRGAPRRVQ